MRVFLISNMFPSERDPLFGVFVKNFKIELERQGVSFPVTALIKGKGKSLLKKALNYSRHYFNVLKSSFSTKYDLVYVHFLSHHIPVLYFLHLLKKPLVINMHGTDFISVRNSTFLTKLSRPILKRANAIVVPTSYFKTMVLGHFDCIDGNRVIISPSGGIDKDIFYKKEGQKKIGEETITIGFVSRFIEEKGWRTFLEALKILETKQIPFNAVIAGKGPDEPKIKESINSLKLASKIQFLGLVEQKSLVDIYNSMDLYAFPTYREAESLGLTGLEAMACGVPIIACNIAGPSTYIKPGENGFLFEPRQSSELAACIETYLGMTMEEKEQMKINAQKTSSNYEKSFVAKSLKEHLKKLP